MTDTQDSAPADTDAQTAESASLPQEVADHAKDVAKSQGFQAQIYKAISVQRPVILE